MPSCTHVSSAMINSWAGRQGQKGSLTQNKNGWVCVGRSRVLTTGIMLSANACMFASFLDRSGSGCGNISRTVGSQEVLPRTFPCLPEVPFFSPYYHTFGRKIWTTASIPGNIRKYQGYRPVVLICSIISGKNEDTSVENRFLTTKQVSELIHVTEETVISYTKRKKDPLPAIKLGRSYLIDRDDLEKWLQNRKNTQDE
jgi:excisionase family DNA binding protein